VSRAKGPEETVSLARRATVFSEVGIKGKEDIFLKDKSAVGETHMIKGVDFFCKAG
jgi:hypothetical protein